MNIFLIRHGETEANIKLGANAILTSKGKKQISKLAKKLGNFKLDIIFSSNLERASITAKEIQKINQNAQLVETEKLQEIYRLIIGGTSKEGTRENRFEEDFQRAENFWKEMANWPYKNVAIVCHGNIIRFFLSKALNKPLEDAHKIEIDPASITMLNITKDKVKVSLINDTSHIPQELSTEKSVYVE